MSRQGIGQLLELLGMTAAQKSIGPLLEIDALGPHLIGQPVVLIEADPCGEGQIRADAYEHAAPVPIAEVKAVLHNPTVGQLQMPARGLSDGGHDTGRLPGFENDQNLIGLGPLEIGSHEVITPSGGCIQNGRIPLLGTVLDPVVELLGDVAQALASHSLAVAVGIKETDHPLGLLEGLDQAVEQNAIKAAVAEVDAMLMMLVEGVHGVLHVVQTGTYAVNAFATVTPGGAPPSMGWLVSFVTSGGQRLRGTFELASAWWPVRP